MSERAFGKARDLSQNEAWDYLILLDATGEIELVDRPNKSQTWADLISPRPGQQVRVRTSMAGVDFYRVLLDNRGENGSAGATKAPEIFRPTPAFAIVLYRFAKMLAKKFQIAKIVWGGIGSGRNPTDCHSTGHCVDFFGAYVLGDIGFDVRRDWWRRTVFNRDLHRTPHAAIGDDHWGNDRNTYFRLAVSEDPVDLMPAMFFGSVYRFITEECTLGADIAADLFVSGSPLQAGTVFHPDYPVPGVPGIQAGRRGHNDHIHFQLGNAFG